MFYINSLEKPRKYNVLSNSTYTEKYSGKIVGQFYYPERRKSFPSPFDRVEIIDDTFVYSYDSPDKKAWIDKENMKVYFGHRVCVLEEC